MEKDEHSDIITDIKSIEANEIIKELEEHNAQLRLEIGERIKAQNSMKQGEKFLQLIISSIDEMFIYIIDDRGMINFAWAPESLEKKYGLKFQEHLGKNFEELLKDLTHEENIVPTSDPFKNEQPYRREYLIKTPNGKRWIDTTFSPLIDKKYFINGKVIASRDITEIKKIEQELKIGNERFRLMAETIQDGIIIFEDKNLVYVNNRVKNILEYNGYDKGDLIKNTLANIVPEDKEKIIQFIGSCKNTGNLFREITFWIIRKDGEKRCLLSKFSSAIFENKSFIFIAISDITEQEIFKHSLQELNEKLELRIVEKTNELLDTNRKLQQEINEHKQTEIELQRRLDFEKTISEISSRFLKEQDFQKSIDFTLELIGKFSDASRAYVFQFNDDLTTMTNTHEWCNIGIPPAKPDHDHEEMLTKETPWWMEQLLKGNVIHLKSLTELPEDAISTRRALERHNIKSILTIPLEIKSKLKGFIGFDDVKNTDAWKEEDIRILKVAAEIISYALSKNCF